MKKIASLIKYAGLGMLLYGVMVKPEINPHDFMWWGYLLAWPFAFALSIGQWLFWLLFIVFIVGSSVSVDDRVKKDRLKTDLLRQKLGLPIKSE